MNIYKRVCIQFFTCNAAVYEETLLLHITSKLLPLWLRNTWSTELWTIPHGSKMWHQSARINSANSHVACVTYATEVMEYGGSTEIGIYKKQEGGEEWWKSEFTVRLLFVVFVFIGFAQFPAKDSVLTAAGRKVITLPCCFNDRHDTGLPYHATFDLLRQWLLLNMHNKITSTHDKTIISLCVLYK